MSNISKYNKISKCINCGKVFKSGEYLQAFIRNHDEPDGSWTDPIFVDDLFQERIKFNGDKITRRHYESCKL